jgi:hypothetical protein
MLRTHQRGLAKLGVVLIAAILAGKAGAASLKPETVKAWDSYLASAEAGLQQRLAPDNHFLWVDEDPDRLDQVHAGKVLVVSADPQNPRKVPSGLIHNWLGAAFVPNTTLANVLATVRDYDHYKDFYQPAVVESKAMPAEGSDDRFSMLLMNKSVVSKSALESNYQITYVRVDSKRYYSISRATRIQEIEKPGSPEEHMLPPDEGTGLIWRLSSITRFEERDGGVYIELQAIALSRDIPGSLHWLIAPIVRRVSRNSLTTSLEQTTEAVQSEATLAARTPVHVEASNSGSLTSAPVSIPRNSFR